jgi:TetR/AcrR family transcriptional regulator, mexJK operon transcriptional repressor
LIEAAGTVFLRKGYHAATMNDVAKAAGISKKTIYELFKSKGELFCAIIDDQQRDIAFPEPEPDWSVVDILTANLVCLAYFLLAPERLSFVRLVLAEYTHSPDFSRGIMRNGVMKTMARLEDVLAGVVRAQGFSSADAKELSAMLFGMALGEFHIHALIGFRVRPTRRILEARARRAAEIIIAGCSIGMPAGLPSAAYDASQPRA